MVKKKCFQGKYLSTDCRFPFQSGRILRDKLVDGGPWSAWLKLVSSVVHINMVGASVDILLSNAELESIFFVAHEGKVRKELDSGCREYWLNTFHFP